MQNLILLQTWNQTYAFVKQTLVSLTDDNAALRLLPTTSSAGFLLQHMAESGVLLLNAIFNANINFSGVTLNGATDEGQTGNAAFVQSLWNQFDEHVQTSIKYAAQFPPTHTFESFLGPKTAAEGLAVITYHTNYHLGQAQLSLKRGQVYEPQLVAA